LSDKILTDVRNALASFGGSEFDARENSEALKDMWDKLQDLRREMNAAKQKAAEEAAKPYMEAMGEVQRRYAFILKLQS